jgi:uncharacterized protein (TIRG00374 family)
MNKSTKSIIQFIVLLGVGILLVWLSFSSVWTEKDKILNSFKNANYFWVSISLVLAFLAHFLRAYRWNYLLKPAGYSVKPINALCAVFVSYFANYGLPRMGEITRCTLVTKYDDVPFEVALGTVITERIVDFMILLLVFFLTLLAQFTQLKGLAVQYVFDPMMIKLNTAIANPVKLSIVIGLVLLMILALWLLRKKLANLLKGKAGNILKGFAKGLSSVKDIEHKFQFIVLSLAIWAAYFYTLYVSLFVFTGTSHLGQSECLALLLFGTLGSIFTPGGLGVYPAIITGLLIYTYGVDDITAFAFPWMTWTSQFILVVSLGLISLIILPIINKSKADVVS